jgi:hypothetical protein
VSTAENLIAAGPSGERIGQSSAISAATLGVIAAALLVYVSSSFQLADVFSAKRVMQILLLGPIGAVAAYCVATRPTASFSPLVLFAATKLIIEIALRDRVSYVVDAAASMLGVIVVMGVPARSFEVGAKVLVTGAGFLALLALIQWLILIYSPELSVYVLEPLDEGDVQDAIQHPIALLGLSLHHEYTIAGLPIQRMQSFAKEPSLNVLYFMFPAALAFLRRSMSSIVWGSVLLLYCVLSLSGSILLACAFSVMWWTVSRVTSIRFSLPFGMLLMMGAYLVSLHSSALSILQALDYLSQYGDFLSKTASVTGRGQGAVTNSDIAMHSPFGSSTTSDVPGPWFVNATLEGGWLGVLFLFWFLVRMGRELSQFYALSARGAQRFACALVLGVVACVLIFNDYQMGNYAGLVLLSFLYRTIELRNDATAARAPATA